MKRLALVLALATLSGTAASEGAETKGKQEKAEGYLEYRDGAALIVDGQKVIVSPSTRLELKEDAKDLGSIPLGYEVKAEGVRGADGSLVARKLEAKPNGAALFEKDVRRMTDQAESEYKRAGRFYNQLGKGRTETVGWLAEDGARVERARRVVDSLLPTYVEPGDVRVYVIDNREWNAFAMGNYSIYVFSGLMDDLDDDELAMVLGHELAHATHEHTRKQFKKAMWIQLAALGLTVATTEIDDDTARVVAQLLVAFGTTAWQNGYGRSLEDQADRVGLRYAYEAGYDITKGPRLWQRFATKYGEPGKAVNFFFGNHSLASQRAVNLEKQIALNYPDGPKDTGVRQAVAVKTPAASRTEVAAAPVRAAPAGASALAGSPGGNKGNKKEIHPGMTTAEVRALLGKATQEVSFGARASWIYPAYTVVFENGRVTEVKF
jgi:Zn-dependent protease with chaperone function